MHRRRLCLGTRSALIFGHLALGLFGTTPPAAVGGPGPLERSAIASQRTAPQGCPTDLQALAPQLLADLPSYANRVAIRTSTLGRLLTGPRTTVLATSPADLTPIDLAELGPGSGVSPEDSGLQQVFFTTLERQFWPDRVASLQHHHWLFLAPSSEGWRLALLYSSVDNLNGATNGTAGRGPTRPQETSDGIVGQAVRLWLRDCQAGTVFPDRPASRSPAEGTEP